MVVCQTGLRLSESLRLKQGVHQIDEHNLVILHHPFLLKLSPLFDMNIWIICHDLKPDSFQNVMLSKW